MLIQILVLAIMDPLKGNITLCTDASDLTTGAVLMQDKNIPAYKFYKFELQI